MCTRISRATLPAMATYALVFDIYNDDYIRQEGAKDGMLPESIEKENKIGLLQRENFRHAFQSGAKMAFGTDSGVYPYGDNAKQFGKMVEWGMKPLEAIQEIGRASCRERV